MLATDNHLGANQSDPIRGQDSLNTFREILEIARERQVDFILLAGDLFHENRPTRACLHQTMAMLREYTLGDRPVQMELLSDPFDGKTAGFHFPAVNYEDPNLNVAIPVFSIHGNHDDPQGTGPEGALCALDVLSVAGLVNYFGKVHLASDEAASDPTSDGMQIKPVLLQKGQTRLAMYGVGNIKDARMHYELRSNRVRMFMPEEDDQGKWFNMMLIHQNRVKHGPQNSVPEGMFDDSLDLIVWGHEHDCRIEPEAVPRKNYFITQPGSSVATSLSQGESIQKKVGILSIQGDQFDIEPVVLKTVRPFKIGEIVMEEEADDPANDLDLQLRDSVTAFLEKKVEQLIAEARTEWETLEHEPEEEMMLPLIRLKVETTGVKELMNAGRFGQRFTDKIANPKDVLQYYRKKAPIKKRDRVTADQPDLEDLDGMDGDVESAGTSGVSRVRMGELVSRFLEAQTLEVLAENALEEAVTRFVDKDDTEAIRDVINSILDSATKGIKTNTTEDNIDDQDTFRELATKEKQAFASQPFQRSKPAKKTGRTQRAQSDDSMLEDDDFPQQVEESDVSMSSTARGGRKTGAKGKTAAAPKRAATQKTAAAKKGKQATPLFADDDDDEEEEEEEFVPRAQRGANGRAAAPKKAPAATKKAPAKKATTARATPARQSQLSFAAPSQASQSASRPSRTTGSKKTIAIDISDDDD
ncbi:meiotic recombination [Naganishia albida]|nr:meiotic recombination [Naganishia albida]